MNMFLGAMKQIPEIHTVLEQICQDNIMMERKKGVNGCINLEEENDCARQNHLVSEL